MRLGQMGLMEYLLMAVFMLMLIIFIIFFFFGWEFGVMRSEKTAETYDRALYSLKVFTNSKFFTKKNLMLDDSKLTMMECGDIEKIIGEKACVEAGTVLLIGQEKVECTLANYPDCNSWVICRDFCSRDLLGYDIPVNIYRSMDSKVELGILTIKVMT